MYSTYGIKVTPRTLKRYFILRILDRSRDIFYNKETLSIILEEYHCTESEKNKMYMWFYKCWNSGIWEE